jgi:hypothetical protein
MALVLRLRLVKMAALARDVTAAALPVGRLQFNPLNALGLPDQPYYKDLTDYSLTATEMKDAGMPVGEILAFGISHYIPGVQELYNAEVLSRGNNAAAIATVGQLMQTSLATIRNATYVPATHQNGRSNQPPLIAVPAGASAAEISMYAVVNAARASDSNNSRPNQSINVISLPDVEQVPSLHRKIDYRKWKRQFELVAQSHRWKRIQQLHAIKYLLAGDNTLYEAFTKWYAERERLGILEQPAQMLEYLDNQFIPKPSERILLLNNLTRITQQPYETVDSYYDRLESDLYSSAASVDSLHRMSYFINGLRATLQTHLIAGLTNDATMEGLLLKAKLFELAQKEGKLPPNMYSEKVQQALTVSPDGNHLATTVLNPNVAVYAPQPLLTLPSTVVPVQAAQYNTQAQLLPPVAVVPPVNVNEQLLRTMQQMNDNMQELARNRNRNNNRNNQQNDYNNNGNNNNNNNNRNNRGNNRYSGSSNSGNSDNNSSQNNNNNSSNNEMRQQNNGRRNNDSRFNQPPNEGPYHFTRPCEWCHMDNHSIDTCYRRNNAEISQEFRNRYRNAAPTAAPANRQQ